MKNTDKNNFLDKLEKFIGGAGCLIFNFEKIKNDTDKKFVVSWFEFGDNEIENDQNTEKNIFSVITDANWNIRTIKKHDIYI